MKTFKYKATCGDWTQESNNKRKIVKSAITAAITDAMTGRSSDWCVIRIANDKIVAIGQVDELGILHYSSPYPKYADDKLIPECKANKI